jgi:nicotinic acid mononucleotide adenylyltransferase
MISVGTAALLDYLKIEYPTNEFYFCLGADSFFDLVDGKWQQSDRILNELLYNNKNDNNNIIKRRIVVSYRSNTIEVHGNNNNDTTNLKKQEPLADDTYYTKLQTVVKEYGVQLIQINYNQSNQNNTKNHPSNVSSTFVRTCSDISILQNNTYIIIPSVLDYIQQHKLYQFCN